MTLSDAADNHAVPSATGVAKHHNFNLEIEPKPDLIILAGILRNPAGVATA
jgi:hypothetical protein